MKISVCHCPKPRRYLCNSLATSEKLLSKTYICVSTNLRAVDWKSWDHVGCHAHKNL